MVTASAESRPRPAIRPIRTTGPGHGPRAVHSRKLSESPAWMATPLSPMTRPCLMHPDSDDERMREHDKAAVERLELRSLRNSPGLDYSLRDASSKPASESPLPSPFVYTQRAPLSAPLFPPPAPRRLTVAEETRNMLMYEPVPGEPGLPTQGMGRRGSVPTGAMRLRIMQNQRHREALRYYGLASSRGIRKADLLVIPAELGRLSSISRPDEDGVLPSPYPVDGCLTMRAIVHSPDNKPMVLARTFNLEELRATIPPRTPLSSVPPSRRTSMTSHRLLTPLSSAPAFSPQPWYIPIERRHSITGPSNPVSIQHPYGANTRAIRHRVGAVPIHLEYARMYLPVLAAIILSELVRPGDVLELPLPHPMAWVDTLTYTYYTGRTKLTEPIRQNIAYLGGRP